MSEEPESQASEERFRATLDNMLEGCQIIGRDWRYLYLNAAVARHGRRAKEELLGRTMMECYPGIEATEMFVALRRCMEERTPTRMENEFIYPDGSRGWFDLSIQPVPEGVFLLSVEISDRKRAEEALRESEERLTAIIGSAMDAVVSADENQHIVVFNPAAERVFRCAAADAIGQPLERFIPDRFHEAHRRHLTSFSESGKTHRQMGALGEVVGLRADGEEFPAEISISLATVGGGKLFTAILRDLTERKRAEAERLEMERRMEQTQRLESLGVLAGGIAHDFNNLLTGVLGNVDLGLVDLPRDSPARQRLEQIAKASRQAADLCRQMLAYASQGRLLVEPIDLRGVVEEIAQLLRTVVSRQVLLNLNLDKNLPPMSGDASQIRQLVMNLVINASEAFLEGGGVITVSSGVQECSQEYLAQTYLDESLAPGRYLYLEVADTGCGMDEETRRRIFEPFFTTKFTGRGLGLSAILGIVRAHRGAIKVYSEVGKGTSVKVLFPAATALAADQERPSAAQTSWRGAGRVLLVDDEEAVRSVAAEMLALLGFEVLTAVDGRQALELYRQRGAEIDLVLLDLTMPQMGGEQTFRALRELNPAVRVVLASGYGANDVASRFAGKGLAGVLQKPFSLETLSELFSGLLPPAGD